MANGQGQITRPQHPIRKHHRVKESALRYAIAFGILIAFSPALAGGLQFQCGKMDGHSYYANEGLFEGDSGWTDNRINTDTVISFDLDEGTIDYRVNSLGRWVTPEMEGGSTSLINIDDDGSLQFVAIWPNTSTEIVTIAEMDSENYTAIMLLSQAKNGTLGANASAFKGECTVTAY